MFQEYNKVGVNWERTVIVLKFANRLPVPVKARKSPSPKYSSTLIKSD